MVLAFKLVTVDSKYCDYLRKFDSKVPYNRNKKELRPFVGILFTINSFEYFAPLSSPKLKHKKMHNVIDFVKLDDGNLGAINFNNMIPVDVRNYKEIDLNKEYSKKEDKNYQILLLKQLKWLNNHQRYIKNKSSNLYNKFVTDDLPKSIKSRCCNFMLLEEKCLEYNKELASV